MSCLSRSLENIRSYWQHPALGVSPEDFEADLELVEVLLCSSQTHAAWTFWGERVVVFLDGRSVSLDMLSKSIRQVGRREKVLSMTTAQKVAGMDIVVKLRDLYEETDRQMRILCFLTRIFVWIREFGERMPYTDRWHIGPGGTASDNFRYYSEADVSRLFGGRLVSDNFGGQTYDVCDSREGFNWSVREDRIRALHRQTAVRA